MRTRTRYKPIPKKNYRFKSRRNNNATIIDFFMISWIFALMIFVMVMLWAGKGNNGEILIKTIWVISFWSYFLARNKIHNWVYALLHKLYTKLRNMNESHIMFLLLLPFLLLFARWNLWVFSIYTIIYMAFIYYIFSRSKYSFKEGNSLNQKLSINTLNTQNYLRPNKDKLIEAKKKIREDEYKMWILLRAWVASFLVVSSVMSVVFTLGFSWYKILETFWMLIWFASIVGYFWYLILLSLKYKNYLHPENDRYLFFDLFGKDYVYSRDKNELWWYDHVFNKKR